MKRKTKRECLKGGLTVSFALKPDGKKEYVVSGLWVSGKLSKQSRKKYGGDSYWIWKTLSDWFKARKPMLDQARKCR